VLNFTGNARNLPVTLVHARDDAVSPFAQSQWLADEAERLNLGSIKLVAVDHGGHSVAVVEDHIPALMAFFDGKRRIESPERVSFRTSSWEYTRAYWLDVVLKAEGAFGGADFSVVHATRTLVIHELDSGLEAARVDLDKAGLGGGAPLSIRVESEPQASLVLTGLGEARTVDVGQEGKATVVRPVVRGQVRLDGLGVGSYRLALRPSVAGGPSGVPESR
jgi:hypothetical protein